MEFSMTVLHCVLHEAQAARLQMTACWTLGNSTNPSAAQSTTFEDAAAFFCMDVGSDDCTLSANESLHVQNRCITH